MLKAGNLHGIFVGDRPMFEALLRAVALNRIAPPVDRVFAFADAAAAYAYQAAGGFVGKVVVRF
jgi:NADPH:quinone reductase-like Zn-dependent oxidoreductase